MPVEDEDIELVHPRDETRRGAPHTGRIGLALGAGGPVGHAYHAGLLRALEHALGWDARRVELAIGTSAGAQVAALLRAGLHGADLCDRVTGTPMRTSAHEVARHYLRPSHHVPHDPRSYRPAAPRYVARWLRTPTLSRAGRLVAAALPMGRVRLDALRDGLFAMHGEDWPRDGLWITAVELEDGEPVVFGSAGAPGIDVGTAVACSAAVPGVFRPVTHGGRLYVDGGVHSTLHLEHLASEKLDLVIASSPLSVFPPVRAMVRREVRALERTSPVALFEPTGEVAAVMGYRPMSLDRGPRVAEAAYRTALAQIDAPGPIRDHLRDRF